MMSTVTIKIRVNGTTKTTDLMCNSETTSISLNLENGHEKTYTDRNFYECFGQVRADNPDIQFLCKGSKINVHPSSMSAQMTLGLKAYELTLGKSSSLSDVVYIFDYDEDNLTNNPNEQREFFMRWIASEKTD